MLFRSDIFLRGAVESVGQEVAGQLFNQLESFGGYAFNKSHAVCYTIIGYACAWLKHYFPIEWWTSVLQNSDRKEIEEKFWPHCGHLIDSPDINKSGDTFIVNGDRILAPLDLIQGIGPAASAELNAGRPYTDIQDFCQKIADQKLKKVASKDKEGKEVVKNGRSAIHSGIAYKLICSGVMDSLFGPDVINEIGQKLEAYERITAICAKKKKFKPVDPFYTTMNPLQRYQDKKSILSVFGADLIPVILDMGVPGFKRTTTGYEYTCKDGRIGVVDHKNLEILKHMFPVPREGIETVVIAYVLSDERRTYQKDGAAHPMAKLVLDIEGGRFEMVQWPKKAKLPLEYGQNLKGAVVAAVLSRWNAGSEMSVRGIEILQQPLSEKSEEVSPL